MAVQKVLCALLLGFAAALCVGGATPLPTIASKQTVLLTSSAAFAFPITPASAGSLAIRLDSCGGAVRAELLADNATSVLTTTLGAIANVSIDPSGVFIDDSLARAFSADNQRWSQPQSYYYPRSCYLRYTNPQACYFQNCPVCANSSDCVSCTACAQCQTGWLPAAQQYLLQVTMAGGGKASVTRDFGLLPPPPVASTGSVGSYFQIDIISGHVQFAPGAATDGTQPASLQYRLFADSSNGISNVYSVCGAEASVALTDWAALPSARNFFGNQLIDIPFPSTAGLASGPHQLGVLVRQADGGRAPYVPQLKVETRFEVSGSGGTALLWWIVWLVLIAAVLGCGGYAVWYFFVRSSPRALQAPLLMPEPLAEHEVAYAVLPAAPRPVV